MELAILSTFHEDDNLNVYENYVLTSEQFVVLVGQIVDSGLVDFMEENGSEFRFFDILNEEGWDFSKGSLELCYDIKLPKTCYELILTVHDDERRRKLKIFFETGKYYLKEEGCLLWDD